MKVAVIGVGYVGLTTGVALACIGHEVTCVDTDEAKLALLKSGKSPIHEHAIDQAMKLASKRIRYTNDTRAAVAEAAMILIAVGTPPREDGQANTSYVEAAASEAAQGMQSGRSYTVVVKSTVPIGTNRKVAAVISGSLRERGVEAKVSFASNPEFLREGTALYDTFYPDRIVVGSDDEEGLSSVYQMYRPILEQTFEPPPFLPRPEAMKPPTLISADLTSAEIAKYASNAFLAAKISFINEMAGLCEKVGGDVVEVSRAMGLDNRIGPKFLSAGIGWGGSCFPKDTLALMAVAKEHDYTMPLVQASVDVNYRQRLHVVERLREILGGVEGKTVAVLGLTFKPGTDDMRESPAVDIIRLLCDQGAKVHAHDPVAMASARTLLAESAVEFFDDPSKACAHADVLLIATEWPLYRKLDLGRLAKSMNTPLLLDGRNFLSPTDCADAGFSYYGIGR